LVEKSERKSQTSHPITVLVTPVVHTGGKKRGGTGGLEKEEEKD